VEPIGKETLGGGVREDIWEGWGLRRTRGVLAKATKGERGFWEGPLALARPKREKGAEGGSTRYQAKNPTSAFCGANVFDFSTPRTQKRTPSTVTKVVQ